MLVDSSLALPEPASTRIIDNIVRHPVLYWIIGGTLLFGLQILINGVEILYATLVFGFVVATGVALNALGGITTLPGLCVFTLALQHVLISQVAKLCFGEPADVPLSQPIATMAVYCIGMVSLLAASLIVQRHHVMERISPVFRVEEVKKLTQTQLFALVLMTIVFATLRSLIIAMMGMSEDGEVVSGGILGPLKTMTFLTPFSVALSTYYVIKTSGGRHSVGLINGVALGIPMIFGIIGAGRAATAGALVIYVYTCFAFGYRFRPQNYIALAGCAYVFQFIISPYALIARNQVRTSDFGMNFRLASELLVEVALNPGEAAESEAKKQASNSAHQYFSSFLPTLERYSMLMNVDAIVNATLQDGITQWETITPGIEMLLPRFLYSDKPVYGTANFLAHRALGLVGEDDMTTQVNLGFFSDAFSSFKWLGISVIPFMILILLTVAYQKTVGCQLRNNPYSIAVAFSLPWVFSETTIASQIAVIFQTPILFLVTLIMIHRMSKFLSPHITANFT